MKRLLIVDDEISIFNIIKKSIDKVRQNNYIIDYAPDGKKGLYLFKKRSYDIIITDFNMPSMNGIELIREIKKINDKIPVFLITGNRRVIMKGIRVIYKPFSIETIRNIIK